MFQVQAATVGLQVLSNVPSLYLSSNFDFLGVEITMACSMISLISLLAI